MNPVPAIPSHVTLIAVSKQQNDAAIHAALETGLRQFGENKIQEAEAHWIHRRGAYPDLTLHLIGPLQSNKAANAVRLFDVIHTVDRPKIVTALMAEMKKQNRNLPCFIQVNVGNEPQKSGVSFADLPAFYDFCIAQGMHIIGLMCIPPFDHNAAPYFKQLKQAADQMALPHLSMGMSDDYESAIDHGATFIRLGSALFGARHD